VIRFLLDKKPASGIYNLGTGRAGTFLELANALFKKLQKDVKINWTPTPVEFRSGYQYKTQADMTKLRKAGYTTEFTSLEKGIDQYVTELLKK
jgi:ADP-L-glycero-D-manno-heptose 6-epimerase